MTDCWIKALAYLAKVTPIRGIRRLVEGRRVLRNPHAVPKDHADDLLEKGLKGLGHVEAHDPLWVKAMAKMTSSLITPIHIRKPHVQSWISTNREDLKLLAHSGTLDSDGAPYTRLRETYMESSGEGERYADSTIHTIYAYLRYRLHAEVKDRGVAAQVELGLEAIALGIQEMSNPSLTPSHSHRSANATEPSLSVDIAEVQALFGDASRLLLNWPQETNGHWIERPQLHVLRQRTTEERKTPTVLLGRPGSGKSAILARLGTQLQEDDELTLLAIKADQLPRDCRSVADIDLYVGCSLLDAMRKLAESRRVVVLIDQLDALADLMDQHSGRLGALLQLARSACAIHRVSVLMSCREFEYRSDLRLSTLDAAEVRLDIPPWEIIEPLLRRAGVAVRELTDEQCEVLRTPQHLAVFVRYFAMRAAPPVFATYQALLDHATRDLASRRGARALAAAEHIATMMAEDEELWVARTRFAAEYGEEADHLLADEFLVLSDNELSVSFRHQTMFDFLRARAFLRGTTNLAEYIIHSKQESLFVRPVLWSALAYLRGSDATVYRREFDALWHTPNLRLHLRLLLASHLGQLADPDTVEAGWLLPTLSDSVLRPRVLSAMAGSPGWFELMGPHLGTCMVASPAQAREVTFLLDRALTFARADVLDLLRENWLGKDDHCALAMNVLASLETWDSKSGNLAAQFAAQAGRMGMDAFLVCQIVSKAVDEVPTHAARVLFRYIAARSTREAGPQGLSSLIRHDHNWSRLANPISAAPGEFAKAGWPWLKDSLEPLAATAEVKMHRFRACPALFVSMDDKNTLLGAFDIAMAGFAQSDVVGFLTFLAQEEHSDIMLLHSLLARGLKCVASECPTHVVDYLLADPRRLAIGDYQGEHRETLALIAGVMPTISDTDLARLEATVLNCSLYRDHRELGESAEMRFKRRKYDREHRLGLLRAFPPARLSAKADRLRREEERALPWAKAQDSLTIHGGVVGSPMSAAQMGQAKEDDIVRLFEGLPDETGWDHPKRRAGSLVGGSIQASRAFAEFAKAEPYRALQAMARFKPSLQERPAGEALGAMGDADVPPDTLVACIRNLDAQGFSSDEFRQGVARCLNGLAARSAGLDDGTCDLVEGWITDLNTSADEGDGGALVDLDDGEQSKEFASHSLLWSTGPMMVQPTGNYPFLETLARGHLCRSPVDADGFLHVLERHLVRRESTDIWVAMMRYLIHLDRADRERVAAFLVGLLESHPEVIFHAWAVRFVLSGLSWLPQDTLDTVFHDWTSGRWSLGPQATGEVAAVALCRSQDDPIARKRVERYLDDNGYPTPIRQSLATGLAHTFIEAACETECRSFAVPYLVRIIATVDDCVLPALNRLFWDERAMRPDEYTKHILEACLERPQTFDAEHGRALVSRLQSLLAVGWNPVLVCRVAVACVDAQARASGEAALRYSDTDNELIDITLTLHRMRSTRVEGLDLFERLMALSAHGVPKQLAVLDRHAP